MTKHGAGQESMEEQPRTSCCSSSSSTSSSLSNSSSHAGSNTPSTYAAVAAAAICPPPTSSSTSGEVEQRQPCQSEWGKDLVDQCWYWGATAKEELSAAMENQANGTFAVRDASTKGQYTLTLRLDGSNKLIKILVHKDKCGFTADCMDFDSIPSLVQFYRTCSLRDFNDRLDTCLLCPLTAPSWLAREAALKSKPQIDPQHQICLLKCRLEGLHAEYDRISRRYDQLFGQQSALADEHKRKRQTASAYADALKIFERKIGELKKTMLGEEAAQLNLNEREREALAMNIELQEERMEEIGKAQCLMNTAIQNIGRTLARIDEELEELKPRLLKLHKRRDKCRDKLLAMPKQQVTHAQLDRLVQAVSLALDSEPSSLSAFLLRTPLAMPRWDCEQWLWHQATKEQSIALVKSLLPGEPLGSESASRREDDGIFLIRPSSSRPGFYALEISKTGIVHSCLVEYRDPRATALPLEHHLCGGYGFAQTQMLFPSLVDFVRYYSVVPLKEHNSVLDTPLITPALGLHKRAQRKKRAAAEQHGRRAPAPTTGDEPPQPTGK